MNQTTPRILYIYARKSSESEDRQVQSIDDQVNRLKELANSLGITIKEVLTEAKSAKKPYCRPVFDDMLKRIQRGEADGILCWQLNRLSRNPVDSGALSWMLQQGVLKCIQTIDRQYLPDDNVLLFSVESGMANQFIIDLKKNSMRGMVGKADRGWLPSRAPMGYLNDKLEHTIIEDKDRFDLVRKMWDMMLTGNYTPSQILKTANDKWGFRTPKTKRSGGGELANSMIYKIFTNIFYTGMFEWSRKLYKGNHKPMISLEEFDRVQAILGRNGKPRGQTHEFAYTGLIYCEECGSMYTASEKTKWVESEKKFKTYIYYNCTRRKKGITCTQRKPITLEKLEEQIDIQLERYSILPKFKDWALEILNRENNKEIEDRTKVYETQHKAVAETQKEIDALTKMRYRELIDDETFVKERDDLKAKLTKLKANLHNTENRAEKWLELTDKTFNFACYARENFNSGTLEKKREIFAALGWNFSIKDKIVSIKANDWFVPIEKAYPELEAEYRRLELQKYLSAEARNAAFASLILRWGDTWELNP